MKNKILCIFLVVLLSFDIYIPYVNAAQQSQTSGIFESGKEFIERGQHGSVYENMNNNKMSDKTTELAGMLFTIGTFVGIVAVIFLGIKYMTASSSDSKAEIKKKAIIVGVGVFVLFTSEIIWRIVVESLSKTT